MNSKIDKAAIMCIDARMNVIADRLNDGKTLFIRTAAGNPYGASSTLSSIIPTFQIKQIFYIPHTDCGACKFTHNLLLNNEKTTHEIEKNLVSTIRPYAKENYTNAYSSPAELEIKFQELGTQFLRKQYPMVDVQTRIEDTNTYITGEKTLLLLRPSKLSYNEITTSLKLPINSTYVSQHTNFIESMCDIQLSLSVLHIKNIVVATIGNNESSKIFDEIGIIKKELVNQEINFNSVNIDIDNITVDKANPKLMI